MSSLREVPALSRCEDCHGLLPDSAAFCPACGAATAEARLAGARASTSACGEPIGLPGLTVTRPLGRGGTADVYLARQDDLDRLVAVKVLRADVGAGGAWRAFRREAQLVARLSGHPHVLDVFTTGRTADGRPFLVMAYADRGSLEDVIAAEGTLRLDEASRVGRAVAEALRAAHTLGIVHRDVKPANVVLGSDGSVKLADFGIARLVAAQAPSTTGSIAFTPEFVAPEILIGGEVGPWTDVYALAATLVKAMTGTSPHAAREGEEVHALLVRKLLGDPPLLGPEIPPRLADVLTSALAVKPAGRPTLIQLQEALGGIGGGPDAHPTGPCAGAEAGTVARRPVDVRRAVPMAAAAETRPMASDTSVMAAGDVTTTTVPLPALGSQGAVHAGPGPVVESIVGRTGRARRAGRHRRLKVSALTVLIALASAAVARTALDSSDSSRSAAPAATSSSIGQATASPPTTAVVIEAAAQAPTGTPDQSATAATPSPTTAPPRAAPTAATPGGSSSDPLVFLRVYYETLNRRDYEAAYAMLAPEFSAELSFESFVGFWQTIDSVEVLAAAPASTGDTWPRRANLTTRYTTDGRTITELDELTVRPADDGRLLISGYRVVSTM